MTTKNISKLLSNKTVQTQEVKTEPEKELDITTGGKGHATKATIQGGAGGKCEDKEDKKQERKARGKGTQNTAGGDGKDGEKTEDEGNADARSQVQKRIEERMRQMQQQCSTYAPDVLKVVIASIENNQPLLLVGHTGTGKTTIVREAAAVYEKELYRINLTGQTGREDLIGKYILVDGQTVWQDGLLTTAMREGHWILLDEINAALAEVLLAIQAITERKNGALGTLVMTEQVPPEHVTPHPDFRLFATCNPPTYIGLKEFNTATLSRFISVHVDVMSLDHATSYFGALYPALKGDMPVVYDIITRCMTLFFEGEVNYCASMRDVDHIGALMEGGLTLPESIRFGLVEKYLIPEERSSIEEQVKSLLSVYADHIPKLRENVHAEVSAQSVIRDVVDALGAPGLITDADFSKLTACFNEYVDIRNRRISAAEDLNKNTLPS